MASSFAKRKTTRFLGPLLSSSLPHLCTRNGVPGSTRISPLLTQFVDSDSVKSPPFPPIENLNFRDSFTNRFGPKFSSSPNIYQIFLLKPKRSDLSDLFLSTNGQRVVFSSSSGQSRCSSGKCQTGDESKSPEICGTTFDRDESELAETREVVEKMMKSIASLSKAMSFLCVIPMGLGGWFMIGSGCSSMPDILLPTFLASGLSVQMAFVMIRSLEPILLFQRMEALGRLHTTTMSIEIAMQMNLFFSRLHVCFLSCIAVASVGLVYDVFIR
ncbi:unnamed protein product [Cuscuta epithymum]|uniref:Uncharacterized protein n=1 Tax=Cuscuta epithymum TaxID=186058 RepID=A0AAV0CBE9_9ASTE|nr:unnamed protein product [Cuscuta epithymum]